MSAHRPGKATITLPLAMVSMTMPFWTMTGTRVTLPVATCQARAHHRHIRHPLPARRLTRKTLLPILRLSDARISMHGGIPTLVVLHQFCPHSGLRSHGDRCPTQPRVRSAIPASRPFIQLLLLLAEHTHLYRAPASQATFLPEEFHPLLSMRSRLRHLQRGKAATCPRPTPAAARHIREMAQRPHLGRLLLHLGHLAIPRAYQGLISTGVRYWLPTRHEKQSRRRD